VKKIIIGDKNQGVLPDLEFGKIPDFKQVVLKPMPRPDAGKQTQEVTELTQDELKKWTEEQLRAWMPWYENQAEYARRKFNAMLSHPDNNSTSPRFAQFVKERDDLYNYYRLCENNAFAIDVRLSEIFDAEQKQKELARDNKRQQIRNDPEHLKAVKENIDYLGGEERVQQCLEDFKKLFTSIIPPEELSSAMIHVDAIAKRLEDGIYSPEDSRTNLEKIDLVLGFTEELKNNPTYLNKIKSMYAAEGPQVLDDIGHFVFERNRGLAGIDDAQRALEYAKEPTDWSKEPGYGPDGQPNLK
jgi:hypothetical protein